VVAEEAIAEAVADPEAAVAADHTITNSEA
jgi:hypothetical protein